MRQCANAARSEENLRTFAIWDRTEMAGGVGDIILPNFVGVAKCEAAKRTESRTTSFLPHIEVHGLFVIYCFGM